MARRIRWFAIVLLGLALFLALWYLAPPLPTTKLSARQCDHRNAVLLVANVLITFSDLDEERQTRLVRVWDVGTWQQRVTFETKSDPECSAICSPDGRWLAVPGGDYTLTLWDLKTGKTHRGPPCGFGSDPGCFSPDGRFLICHQRDSDSADYRSSQCWDLAANETKAAFEGGQDSVHLGNNWITFAPDGKRLAVVRRDDSKLTSTIEWWGIGQPGQPFILESTRVFDYGNVVLSPTLRAFAQVTGPDDESRYEIRLYDSDTGQVKGTATYQATAKTWRDFRILKLKISPDAQFLFIYEAPTSRDRLKHSSITCLNGETGESLVRVVGFPHRILVSPDSRWTAIITEDGAEVLETRSFQKHGELQFEVDHHFARCYGPPPASFGADGKSVLISGLYRKQETRPPLGWLWYRSASPPTYEKSNFTGLWDVEECRELACFDKSRQALYVPDGKALVTAHADGTVKVWDLPLRKPVLLPVVASLGLLFAFLVSVQGWTRFLRWRNRSRHP